MSEYTTKQLRAMLHEAEARDEKKTAEARKSTPIIRKFTIGRPRRVYDDLFDPDCELYEIFGSVVNKEEAKAAGWRDYEMQEGGMIYIFNKLSGRIACAIGGGTIWVSRGFGMDFSKSAEWAMAKISAFLIQHPEGGDITDIIEAHRANKTGT